MLSLFRRIKGRGHNAILLRSSKDADIKIKLLQYNERCDGYRDDYSHDDDVKNDQEHENFIKFIKKLDFIAHK
uniref:Uncharacterized protein n=1 Tax=Pithovirus LCPAC404 TaxID=2506597 RepID=A0A481ZDU1_9VIRU|nr:MAG: hypothetical protein LCPAC404_00240 [Pithovirus LCPAC404]